MLTGGAGVFKHWGEKRKGVDAIRSRGGGEPPFPDYGLGGGTREEKKDSHLPWSLDFPPRRAPIGQHAFSASPT